MKTFFFTLFLLLTAFAFGQDKLTLKQCIETALANNLDVQQASIQADKRKIDMSQARMNLLPNVDGNASHTFSQGRSIDPYSNSPVTQNVSSSYFALNGELVLFNGLARQNLVRQANFDFNAAKMDWQQAKDLITINVILAYLQVLSNEDQLALLASQAGLTPRQVERQEVQNKEGSIVPSVLSDLKGQYAGEQISIVTLKSSVETSKINLCQLMNIPYAATMELERSAPELSTLQYQDSPDKIYETALQQFALIKSVDFKKQSAAQAVKVARGLLFPRLSFVAGVSTSYSNVALQNHYSNTTYSPTSDSAIINGVKYPVYRFQDHFDAPTKIPYRDQLDNNLSTYYGFSLNIPIFRSFQQRNRVRQAKLDLKNSELIASTTRTQLNQSVNQAYINMLAAADRYKLLLEQVGAYTESFRIAEVRFNAGVGTSIDYLIAKNNLDRANINMITARYDYLLRTKVLDYYQGKSLWP
jgi:outer membrane protein